MKKKINMTTFYIVLGLIGGIIVAISIAGYRIESGKINKERDSIAREERSIISTQVASLSEDLSNKIVIGEEKITKEIGLGISELLTNQEKQSEKTREEIKATKESIINEKSNTPSLNTARFSAQLQLVPFDMKNPSFTIKYLFHNYGVNYAKDFNAFLYVIPSDFSFNNKVNISSATEIAPKLGLSNTGKIGDYTIVENQIPVFFYINLSYFDEIANKMLNQEFFFEWMGIKEGKYSVNIEVVRRDDIYKLKEYITNNIY